MIKRFLLMLAISVFALPVLADTPTEGRAGRAEVRFLEGMIDHHQMALDMAAHCLENADDDAVRSICEDVIAAQTPEIAQMQEWLRAWYGIDYAPMAMQDMGMMQDGLGGMHGDTELATDPPMMMGMMAGLNRLEGREYDLAWLESMIDHHDDAIHMAERILRRGEHEELLALAATIIRDQSAEIATMEALIRALEEEA